MLGYVTALPGKSALRVVHVVSTADEVSDAERGLRDAVGASGAVVVVLVGNPVLALVQDAAAWGATVVAVASWRHSMLRRAIWGSVARGVALHAPCSVLLVPPTGDRPA